MTKSVQFSVFLVLGISILVFSIDVNTHTPTNLDKNEHSTHEHVAREQAERMMKDAALSLITPHLKESLQETVTKTIDVENFQGFPATCFAPDTDQAVVDAFYRNRTTLANSLGLPDSRFNLGSRWGSTASNGGGLSQGDVTTLTWSYVPDGTPIGNGGCGVPDQGTFSSDFIAFFNSIYGGPTTPGDYTTAPWHAVFVDMFDSWSDVSGLVFVYEPNDDGATVVTGGAGILGTRGDFRISGHRLDGNSNVLACNYFPNNGDMIIDTSDNFYINNPGLGTTNVLTHEIGHGLGIQHVCPVEQTKLMEPFVTTAFNGPQEDDILATNRHYGDSNSGNDTPALATFLGSNANPTSYTTTRRSIDDNGDVDYFSFTVNQPTIFSGTLTPTGTTYLDGVQLSNGSCSAGSNFNALTVADLQFEILGTDGTTVLASGDANGVGTNESLTNINLSAAGTYYVRVSQQGTAVDNVQMYDLSISLQAAVLTPEISFGTIARTENEGSACSFTDYDVDVNIALGASADADVTFSVNGSSTATENVDFELLTSSVTFPAGSTATQTMSIRIFEDGIIEGDETAIIDFAVNANGGDASANTSADQFTLTISNDDVAASSSQTLQVYSEDFEDFSEWTNTQAAPDSDAYTWVSISFTSGGFTGFSGQFPASETDLTILRGAGAGTTDPNNYLISPAIAIPANTTDLTFEFYVAGFNNPEYYSVYWSPNTSTATINGLTPLESRENSAADIGEYRSISSSSISDETGHFVIRHHNSDDNAGLLLFDSLTITATVGTSVQTAVNTATAAQFGFNQSGTAYASDNATGNVMATLTNNQSDNYGCTTVSVSRAGTGAQGYNGSTGANQVMDKRFAVGTANTVVSGDVDMIFYLTEMEVVGWETATGNSRNNLYIGRELGGTVVEAVSASIGAFGANVTLGANFSAAEGDFYFGLQSAFESCTGVTKTWNGSVWSPMGAPDSTNAVIIDGNYNTGTNDDLEACEITISSGNTLTVSANSYARSQGNITVEGTLQVDHQGSVLQVDASAVVVNNGTINVDIVTPVLRTLDFMVMGSPMTAETRDGVFEDAFLVLDHTPNNFNPHTDPNIPQGATNFKDLEGDFWNQYNGAINVGEGYIVRPQSGYDDPANTTFSMTYEQGTLNNGDITRTVVYNSTNSPLGTPNVFANPYASGLSADDFIDDNGLNALYFWEHLTPPSVIVPGESIMFDMGDVSIRNLGGGMPANNGGNAPGNVISTGQGFAIKATANGSVTFTNSMRLTENNTLRSTDELQIDRLWLRAESDKYETGNNTLIAFHPNATQGWDNGYDTDRLASMVSLYSQFESGEERMAIQTLGRFDSAIRVPVGFSTLVEDETTYTISILNIEGTNLENANVYLYDSYLDRLVDLKKENYSFMSKVSEDDRRFSVFFEEEGSLGIHDENLESIIAYPNPTQNILNIVSPQVRIESVTVVDVRGRTVQSIHIGGLQSYKLDLANLNSAMYFVEIATANGKVTKRIIKQ